MKTLKTLPDANSAAKIDTEMKRCKQKAQSSECCSQIVLCLAVLTANKVILSSVFEGGAAEGDRERPIWRSSQPGVLVWFGMAPLGCIFLFFH